LEVQAPKRAAQAVPRHRALHERGRQTGVCELGLTPGSRKEAASIAMRLDVDNRATDDVRTNEAHQFDQ
jgi:hypothetical protein